MIKVINRHEFGIRQSDFRPGGKANVNWVYVGRGTPLGNYIGKNIRDRKKSIAKYREGLWADIKSKNENVIDELKRLMSIHNQFGTLYLVCSCKPLPCHGDIVKKCLEWAESRQK